MFAFCSSSRNQLSVQAGATGISAWPDAVVVSKLPARRLPHDPAARNCNRYSHLNKR